MTLPRLFAMNRYWKHAPPVIESAGAIAFGLGVWKQIEEAPQEGTREHDAAMGDFLAALPVRQRPRPA